MLCRSKILARQLKAGEPICTDLHVPRLSSLGADDSLSRLLLNETIGIRERKWEKGKDACNICSL